MIVLSLFDGMSCGQIALERLGVKVDKYYASEIDKYAIKVTNYHYPNTVQLGDINNWKSWDIEIPNVILAGSPCQGFSNAGKGLNFDDPRSKLFFVFLDILNHYKQKNPKLVWLLENVKMKKEWQDKISELVGVRPILINSALVSAQNRNRLYWTNIQNVIQPEDKHLYLKDILEEGEVDREKSYTIDSNYFKGGNPRSYFEDGRRKLIFEHQSQKRAMVKTVPHGFMKEEIKERNKYPSLVGQSPDTKYLVQVGVALDDVYYRKLTPIECERLQTVDRTELSSTINLCLDHQNPYVNVEIRNPKSPLFVGNVEKIEKQENVKYAEKNSVTKNLPIKKLVPVNVHIHYEENKIVVSSLGKSFIIVNNAENNVQYLHHKEINDFVQLLVGMNIIGERITNGGVGECYLKEPYLIHQENGKNFVNLCGIETNLLVKDADLSIKQIKEILKYTTSNLFSLEKDVQILQILFSYVIHVINGYIHQEIQNYSLLNFEIEGVVGWTSMVSNTQRYKMLGNGWTIDVIAHILSFANLL